MKVILQEVKSGKQRVMSQRYADVLVKTGRYTYVETKKRATQKRPAGQTYETRDMVASEEAKEIKETDSE